MANNDVFVAVHESDGAHRWSRKMGGSGYESGYAVAVDAAGDVVVTGQFTSTIADFGGASLTSAGGLDGFLAKYSGLDGNPIWSKRFGGTNHDWPYDMTVNSAGDVIVGGLYRGLADFGGGPHANGGDYDMFLAKFQGSGGAYVWSKGFGGNGFDAITGIELDPVEDIFVSGLSGSIDFNGGGATFDTAGIESWFLGQYAPNGDHLSSQVFVATGNSGANDLVLDAAGNVILAGGLRGGATFGCASATSSGGVSGESATIVKLEL